MPCTLRTSLWKQSGENRKSKAIPHNSKCRYGERGAADAKPKAQIILDAAKVSAASGGNSEPKQGQRSQSARGFCPRSTMRVPQPDIIEHFGNADAVPQPPERCLSRKAGIVRCCLKGIQQLANGLRTAIINCNFTFCAFYTFITGQLCIILRQYRTILSTAPAGIVRCCPKPIERETLPGCQGYEVLPYDSCS